MFSSFLAAILVVSVVGVARIAVASRAAETSIEAGRLEKTLKAERLEGDVLEIQQSALASPSRIRGIAGSTMSMSEAGGICYIRLDAPVVRASSTASDPASGSQPFARTGDESAIIASILRAAFGEAQVLLLGDVGLASSR